MTRTTEKRTALGDTIVVKRYRDPVTGELVREDITMSCDVELREGRDWPQAVRT